MVRKGQPRYAGWLDEGFPLWLRQRLEERAMSISDLARAMPTQASLISRWMQGRQRPTADSAVRIAEVLCLPPDEVLTAAGLRPQQATDADPHLAELTHKLRLVNLTPERYLTLNALLNTMLSVDSPSA